MIESGIEVRNDEDFIKDSLEDLKNEIISENEVKNQNEDSENNDSEFDNFYVNDQGEVFVDGEQIRRIPYLGLDGSGMHDLDFGYKKIYGNIFIGNWSLFDIEHEGRAIYTNGDKYIGGLEGGEPGFKGMYQGHEGRVIRQGEGKMLYNGGGKSEGKFKNNKFINGTFDYNGITLSVERGKISTDGMNIGIEGDATKVVESLRDLCSNLKVAKSVHRDKNQNSIIVVDEIGNSREIRLDETGFKSGKRLSKWMNKYINHRE